MWFKEFFKRGDRDSVVPAVYYALFAGKMIGVPICYLLIDHPKVGRRWLLAPGFLVAAVGTVLSVSITNDVATVAAVSPL